MEVTEDGISAFISNGQPLKALNPIESIDKGIDI